MNDIINKTCEITLNSDTFFEDYVKLIKNEFSENKVILEYVQIKRLIEVAGLFSLSSESKHKQISSKISSYILHQYSVEYPSLPFIVEIILTRLGDLPVIYSMVLNENYPDYFHYFIDDSSEMTNIIELLIQFPEIFRKKISNQSEMHGQILSFTDFQAEVFSHFIHNKNVSFSAPTSGGKSYVVQNYICSKLLNESTYSVIYVAPTKALIAEIQSSIKDKLIEFKAGPSNVKITTSIGEFNLDELESCEKKVFVLTQERLQEIISNDTEISIDLLVVDEA